MSALDPRPSGNRGVVVAVRGSVVDVRFNERLPPIYSVLHAGDDERIVLEVLAQLDAHHVRGIALTTTHGLARGTAVEDTGGPLKAIPLKVTGSSRRAALWRSRRGVGPGPSARSLS